MPDIKKFKFYLSILHTLLNFECCFSVISIKEQLLILQQGSYTSGFKSICVTKTDGSLTVQYNPSQYSVGTNQTFSYCSHYKEDTLLCLHQRKRTLNRIYPLNGNMQNESIISEVRRGLSTTKKFIYDDAHDVIYWYDVYFNKLVMSSLNRESVVPYTLLKTTQMTDFVIASDKGIIFYIEEGYSFNILRSTIHGENIQAIVYKDLIIPTTLDVDESEEKIYWYDNKKRTVEYCNYDGSGRHVIAALRTPIIGIRYLMENIVIAYTEKDIMALDFSHFEHLQITMLAENTNVDSIVILKKKSENSDKCIMLGCAHYCITEMETEKCICTNGYVLHADGKQCLAPKGYADQLVFGILDEKLCYFSLQVILGENEPPTCMEEYKNVSFLSVDSDQRVAYFLANMDGRRSIYTYLIDTREVYDFETHSIINGLVYDTRLRIFYALVNGSIIAMNSTTSSVIRNDLHDARHFTISNEAQLLFWYSHPRGIYVCTPSSGHVSFLVAALFVHSMIYNNINDRLYWTTDGGMWSVKVDGSGFRVEIVLDAFTKLVADYQNLFFLRSSLDDNTVKAYDWERKTFHFDISISKNYTIKEMSVIDSDTSKQKEDKCKKGNGGCEHTCYVSGNEDVNCSCRPGFILANDMRSCSKEMLDDDFLVIFDEGNVALFQIGIKQHSVTLVLDGLKVVNFDLDPHSLKVYFIEENESFFSVFDMKKREMSTIDLKGMFPKQLAFDGKRQMLIFSAYNGTSENLYQVKITDLANIATVEENIAVSSISLSIIHGFAFTSTSGPNGQILKHDYVRMQRMDFLIPNVESSSSLQIDDKQEELYWIEESSFTCFKSTLTPIPRVSIVYHNENVYPKDIAVDDNFIYVLVKNERYILKLSKFLSGADQIIPISPELGLIRSLYVYKKDFCPPLASEGNFKIGSNCSFLPDDVCDYICDGKGNHTNITGTALCSDSMDWTTLDDIKIDINTVCENEDITTTTKRIVADNQKNNDDHTEKDETNNAAIALGVLFALTICGLICTVALLIYKKRRADGKGVILEQAMKVPNRGYRADRIDAYVDRVI